MHAKVGENKVQPKEGGNWPSSGPFCSSIAAAVTSQSHMEGEIIGLLDCFPHKQCKSPLFCICQVITLTCA